jgi:hypothetical protein
LGLRGYAGSRGVTANIANTASVLSATSNDIVTPITLSSLWAKGANIAANGTINIGAGGYFHVTGSATITTINFENSIEGRSAVLFFDNTGSTIVSSQSLLTNDNANNNITSGDIVSVVYEGSGVTRIIQNKNIGGVADESAVIDAIENFIAANNIILTTNSSGNLTGDTYASAIITGATEINANTANSITLANILVSIIEKLDSGEKIAFVNNLFTNISEIRDGFIHADSGLLSVVASSPISIAKLSEYLEANNENLFLNSAIVRYLSKQKTKSYTPTMTWVLDGVRVIDGDSHDSDGLNTIVSDVSGNVVINFSNISTHLEGEKWRCRLVSNTAGTRTVVMSSANGVTIDLNGFTIPSIGAVVGNSVEIEATIVNTSRVRVDGVMTTAPGLGTPISGSLVNCTNLPISGLVASTSSSIGVGSIELGASTDTTITRSAAGVIAVEGVPIFPNLPQNSKSTDYTLQLSDANKHIYHPSADITTRTWTIPGNASVAFPIGTAITFINDTSAGVINIAITTDTLKFAGSGLTGSRSLAAAGVATIIKITSTSWIISGVGLT